MVSSYNTLLAEGSIVISGRPQSARSRSRIATPGSSGAATPNVKVYDNNLFDGGDILGATAAASGEACGPAGAAQQPAQGRLVPQPPMSPLAAGGSQKLQQQRALAAQKRLERLQLGGLAQSNDSIALVSIGGGSRPGTPGTAKLADAVSSSASGFGCMVPAPPAALPGTRSYRARTSGSSGGKGWPDVSGGGGEVLSLAQSSAGAASACRAAPAGACADSDEDLEVETLDEPLVRPGTASAGAPCDAGDGAAKAAAVPKPQPAPVDLSDLGAFLLRPAPPASAGTVMCFIERVKGGMGASPSYRLHLDNGCRFLLAARKRKKTATSAYVISTSASDLSRHGSHAIAKLRSNFVGTGFSIVALGDGAAAAASSSRSGQPHQQEQQQLQQDRALRPPQQAQQRQQLAAASSGGGGRELAVQSSAGGASVGSSGRSTRDSDASSAWGSSEGGGRRELGAVQYELNVLGTRGPRRMSAAVPALDANGSSRWAPAGPEDTIAARLKSGSHAGEQLVVLRNKAPRWNEALAAYCLNFNGRVTQASVKNFQLVTAWDPDAVVLQFGKVSDTCFTCDFSWPLSPLQAFCFCLTSFDNKLACE